MGAQGNRTLPVVRLNEQRRLAVRLRLDGVRLKDVVIRTGLSSPTIIAAYKAYLDQGWSAVDVKPRGRIVGDGRILSIEQERGVLAQLREEAHFEVKDQISLWSANAVRRLLGSLVGNLSDRTVDHYLKRWQLSFGRPEMTTDARRLWQSISYPGIADRAKADGAEIHWVGDRPWDFGTEAAGGTEMRLLYAVSNRGRARWMAYQAPLQADAVIRFFSALIEDVGRNLFLLLDGICLQHFSQIQDWLSLRSERLFVYELPQAPAATARQFANPGVPNKNNSPLRTQHIQFKGDGRAMTLTHLQRLEAESIHIMREVAAEADNPVMLYSIGKDSAVMLHLAMKAFYPARPPFPLLHVDTTWKFREMYEFRDRMAKEHGFDLLVHVNQEGIEMDINPFTHGSAIHTDIMKTQGLKQALDKYGFDVAFGGARRDEEKSRAKERIFSFRSSQHRWDPKGQRPELWRLYNARKNKGESIRVFPISNWTELDIWQYIYLENIPIVPLYYAKERPVVQRDGALIMVDDQRMPLKPGEVPTMRSVRFRTLGCYPLTGAVESTADTLPDIIQEMLLTKTSERQGRVIDHDQAASMEKKKQEGYF